MTLFGTDGIRGKADDPPFDKETLYNIGKAISGLHNKPLKVIMGRDTRISGERIQSQLSAGLADHRTEVYNAGVIPTPGIAYLTAQNDFDFGIVISASHNHYTDNGIKIFNKKGCKLSDMKEKQIESQVITFKNSNPSFSKKKANSASELLEEYIKFLKETVEVDSFAGLNLVADCANGATAGIAEKVFRQLNAEITTICDEPDGKNINRECGSQHLETLSGKVQKHNADMGEAFDGDGDRALFVDSAGRKINGDNILYIFAREMHKKNTLNKNTVVATVMSNIGLKKALEKYGVNMIRTPVGDKAVHEQLVKDGYNLGGEQSGHIICLDYLPTGDGLLTALKMCEAVTYNNSNISELNKDMEAFPQTLINVKVQSKPPLERNERIITALRDVKNSLKDRGRVLVRYSGTEPVARVMLEGENKEKIDTYAQEIADVIESELG